jgi:serine/threonine protein kinase/tetratricopeptide (TPR) repeat protein
VSRLAAKLAPGYVLGPSLGRGGSAAAFLATEAITRRSVVIKAFFGGGPHVLAAARHEAQLLGGLGLGTRSRVPILYLPLLTTDPPCLVEEHIEGPTLQDWMDAQPRGGAERLHAAREVLRALVELHEGRSVHGDIQPRNLILRGDGADSKAVLIDFGLSAQLGEADAYVGPASGGVPGYRAPERELGQGPPHPASDVYSAGVLIERLLASHGGPGWQAAAAQSTPSQWQLEVLNAPRDCRERIARLLARMRSPDIRERPTASIALQELVGASVPFGATDGGESARMETVMVLAARLLFSRPGGDSPPEPHESAAALEHDGLVRAALSRSLARHRAASLSTPPGEYLCVFDWQARLFDSEPAALSVIDELAALGNSTQGHAEHGSGAGIPALGFALDFVRVPGAATHQRDLFVAQSAVRLIADHRQSGHVALGPELRRALGLPDGAPGDRPDALLTMYSADSLRAAFRNAWGSLPFVGREQELALLDSAWDRCRAPAAEARLLELEGEPGVGRRRLTSEWVRSRTVAGAIGRAAMVRCHAGREAPFGVVERLVASLVDPDSKGAWARRRADLIARVEPLFADPARRTAVAGRLWSLLHSRRPSDAPAWMLPDGDHHPEELQAAVVDFVAADARASGGVVLVVEASQSIDPESCAVLGRLLQQQLPLLVVSIPDGPLQADGNLRALASVRSPRLELGPLSPSEMRRLFESAGAGDVIRDPRDAELVWGWSFGYPLLVESVIRAHQRGETVEQSYLNAKPSQSASARLQAWIDAKLGRLDAGTAKALAILCLTEEPVSSAELASALAADRPRVEEQVSALVEGDWLEIPREIDAGLGAARYRARSSVVASLVARTMSPAAAASAHAGWWRVFRARPGRDRAALVRMARHAEGGHLWLQAAEDFLDVARQTRAAAGAAAAKDLLQRAKACFELAARQEEPEIERLRFEICEEVLTSRYLERDYPAVVAELPTDLVELGFSNPRHSFQSARVVLVASMAAAKAGQVERSRELCDDAISMVHFAPPFESLLIRAMAVRIRAWIAIGVGHTSASQGALADLRSVLSEFGDSSRAPVLGALHGLAGVHCARLGMLEDARVHVSDALACFREPEQVRERAMVLMNAGYVSSLAGDDCDATKYYEEAATLAAGIGDAEQEGLCAHNLGDIAHRAGDLEKARQLLTVAAAALESGEGSPSSPECRMTLSEVLLELGERDAGRAEAAKALRLLPSTSQGRFGLRGRALFVGAAFAALGGDRGAQRKRTEAIAVARRSGREADLEFGEALYAFTLARFGTREVRQSAAETLRAQVQSLAEQATMGPLTRRWSELIDSMKGE